MHSARMFVIALVALVAVAAVAGCRRSDDLATPRPILILSAFPDELEGLVREAKGVQTVRRAGNTYHVGALAGRPVVLALTGVGMTRAQQVAQEAITAFPPAMVLFVGIAGGIDPQLGVGDVVVPAEWGQHDGSAAPSWFAVDRGLAALVPAGVRLRACERQPPCAASPRVARGGRGVSGSEFIADPALGRRLWDEHAARIVDMETSAVAEIAAVNRVPFLAFRAISDVVTTGASHDDVDEFSPVATANAASVALGFLERLPAPAP